MTGWRSPASPTTRLDHLGRTLGFDLTTPAGATRARLAVTAWRLLRD